jgi:hypothetical protein
MSGVKRATPEVYFRQASKVTPTYVNSTPYYPQQDVDPAFKWLIAGAVILGFFALLAVVSKK